MVKTRVLTSGRRTQVEEDRMITETVMTEEEDMISETAMREDEDMITEAVAIRAEALSREGIVIRTEVAIIGMEDTEGGQGGVEQGVAAAATSWLPTNPKPWLIFSITSE